jgi:glycerate-2-kinase
MHNARRLRDDALAIWQAGVEAVRSDKLVRDVISRSGDELVICGQRIKLAGLRRIAVVGAGKAGAGMAAGVEEALGPDVVSAQVEGWVNVPADCVRPLAKIHLHAGRPAGVNEPTAEGVEGARRILEIVSSLSPRDLCLVLISGGGSALLPLPVDGITLADKQAVTRLLMNSGATIEELNAVRKRLSKIKGGKLAQASRAGQLIALVISDIVGDPLEMIASGPTYPDRTIDAEALAILEKFDARPPEIPWRVFDYLRRAASHPAPAAPFPANVANQIIGNNATALAAAAQQAADLGYRVVSLGSNKTGEANATGATYARCCKKLRDDGGADVYPTCILSGGEPVVHLAPTDQPRKGGRNQQLVLAGLATLMADGMQRIVLLSGGTDGEDGPTDAAGAFADAEIVQATRNVGLDPEQYRVINDAYTFFEQVGGLIKTGPTHTNVMDLRVMLIGRPQTTAPEHSAPA